MANNNVDLVTVAKPKVGGAVFIAPKGTTLPTNATSALSASYINLGYISSDGVSKTLERSTGEIQAWGGDIVLNPQESYKEGAKMTFLEALNENVLKTVYGKENVTGTLATGITVKGNSKELETGVLVIDTVLTNDVPSRLVYPLAKITEVGEVSLTDSDAVGYEATFSCYPDSSQNYRYEYIGGASS